MQYVRLGRTGLEVSRTSFGVLPLQRTPMDEAIAILRRAREAGITFFDTARAYSNSEEKLGAAFQGDHRVILATKTAADARSGVLEHLSVSLHNLRRDYVDLLQLHNPKTLPSATDPESAYQGLREARARGTARFIGITSHQLLLAIRAAESGLYDTVQFPLSALSDEKDLGLIEVCRRHDVGLIAMKPLCGGLLSHIPAAFAFLCQFTTVVPIWGIQHLWELEEFLNLEENPPALTDEMRAVFTRLKVELGKNFCRGCGYCLPCPVGIPIPMAARMAFLLRRAPWSNFITDEWNEQMERIAQCTGCGECKKRCPYGLDTPDILKRMLDDYRQFRRAHSR